TPHHGDIVSPAGPIDPDVGVLTARAPKGKITGLVVNFACHNTVLGGDLFTPDYVGYIRKHLKGHYGENTLIVFLLGACGDINQVDNFSTSRKFITNHGNMIVKQLAG